MQGLVLIIHILVCLFLVIIVLLQSGKSADLAGAFGGSGSQSSFGARGTASILSKMTTALAVMFMVTSLSLWLLAAEEADKEGSKVKFETVRVTVADEVTRKPVRDAKVIISYIKPGSIEDELVTPQAQTDRQGVAKVKVYDKDIDKVTVDIEVEGYEIFQTRNIVYENALRFEIKPLPADKKKEAKQEEKKTPDKKQKTEEKKNS